MLNENLKNFVNKCFRDVRVNYIDVGSSLPINRLALFFKNQFSFIFFEPNKREFMILKKYLNKNFKSFKVFNSAVSNINKVKFYIYDRYKLSSVHELDEKYNDIYRKIKIKEKKTFRCIKLQKILKRKNKQDVFFLKIDTQGHSLPVLQSLKNKIKYISFLVVEVEKIPTYKKSFGSSHIDLFLKKNNFLELGRINDYRWSKNYKNNKFRYLGKELSYAEDRIYIRNIFTSHVNKYDLKLIILFCIIFDYLDFGMFLVEKFKNKLEKNFYIQVKKEINNKLKLNQKFISNQLQLFYKKKISLSNLIQNFDKFSEIFSKKYVF